ncbi:uncharacterized protein ISCGN_024710 [Ixodes scapularis]
MTQLLVGDLVSNCGLCTLVFGVQACASKSRPLARVSSQSRSRWTFSSAVGLRAAAFVRLVASCCVCFSEPQSPPRSGRPSSRLGGTSYCPTGMANHLVRCLKARLPSSPLTAPQS